jgi:catechol 2,3-dioxygenase-like lactoylglutathione lyase family enzyme
MADHPVIEDAVAVVPVSAVEATVAFYRDRLGFEDRFVSDDAAFAIVVHGDAAIHFVATDDAAALAATASYTSLYLWCRGVDALYDRLAPALADLPAGRVRAPFTQPYGMREFHVKDPDGCLLMFGEDTDVER